MAFVTTKIKRDVLSKAINTAAKAVSPSPIIPLLGNVLLESANGSSRVAGTNFELGIGYTFPTTGEAFRTCVPAKTFASLIDVLSADEVEIRVDPVDQSAVVFTDSSNSTIKCASADEFPEIPKVTKAHVTIAATQFKEMVQRVAFASSSTGEGTLTGVQLLVEDKKFIMFATDGYHMSFEEFTLPKKGKAFNVIIKGTTLETISRILGEEGDVQIQAEENKVLFHCGAVDVVSQLMSGTFPDYKLLQQSFGTPTTTLILSTIELFRACRQLRVFASDNTISKLEVQGMLVRHSIQTKDRGDSDISLAAIKTGEDLTIGLNVNLMYQFLEVCKTQQVQVEFRGAAAAVTFKMQGYDAFYHIIMPMSLKQ